MNIFAKIISKEFIFLIVFLFSFLFSVSNNFYQMNSFDNYKISETTEERHSMITGDIEEFYREGDLISNEIRNGKNYFNTGGEYRRPYLPSRIFALFSLTSKEELYDFNNRVKLNNSKIYILLCQSIIYYFLLFVLYRKIVSLFPKSICKLTILFLAFEPTILMYHSSFWSESVFFSLQILLIIFFLKKEFNFFSLFLFGLLLGLFYLQRSVAVFYIFPILLLFYFKEKKNFLQKLIFISLGYIAIHVFVGFHNYERSGKFYTFSTQAKDGFYIYLAPEILAKKKNITIKDANNILQEKKFLWVDDNNLNLKNESDKLKYYEYQKNEAFKIIIQNPFISLKVIIKRTMHFLVIDPVTHVYYFHNWNHDDGNFYKSDEHKRWIIPRIIYSVFIYIICFIGFLNFYKNRDKRYLFLYLVLSILYFILVQSWYGGTRYFTPILIYLSFFFAHGVNSLYQKKFYLIK